MSNSTAIPVLAKALKRALLPRALPRLEQLPSAEWDESLKQARQTNFDIVERVGVFVGIAFTTYLLRFESNEAEMSVPFRFFTQFLTAAPLLVLFVGPLYLRCLRRGLDRVIEHRHLAG